MRQQPIFKADPVLIASAGKRSDKKYSRKSWHILSTRPSLREGRAWQKDASTTEAFESKLATQKVDLG